ncbi:MAG: hypothetical protein GSR82_01875 [Desulfurococcales archaeon]|nr:hypothetical protein [Desulfurococcales archaeon]
MEKHVSIPFVQFAQKDRLYYAENHFVKFFVDSPKMFALIYSRDLGFTKSPLPGFKPLQPFLDASRLVSKIRENIYDLEVKYMKNQPIKSLSIKDTLKYVLSVIAGFGYHSKPPKLRIEKRSAELSNAYNYVNRILGLKVDTPFNVVRQIWLDLKVLINDNRIECYIVNENMEENRYRVIEILARENNELAEYITRI